eukprot:7414145-Alexandrium_andersonii.AAC.2
MDKPSQSADRSSPNRGRPPDHRQRRASPRRPSRLSPARASLGGTKDLTRQKEGESCARARPGRR